MNIILVHPMHGAKVATQCAELEQDIKNGWVKYDSDIPRAPARKPKKDKSANDGSEESFNETPDFLIPVSDDSESK